MSTGVSGMTDDDLDDLQADLESLTAIVDADDKQAELLRQLQESRTALKQVKALQQRQGEQLVTAQRECKRLTIRLQKFERGELK